MTELLFLVFTLLAGVLLYAPFFLWRRFGQVADKARIRLKMTRAGLLLAVAMGALMLVGPITKALAPGTLLGQLTHDSAGMWLWLILSVLMGMWAETLLRRRGIVSVQRHIALPRACAASGPPTQQDLMRALLATSAVRALCQTLNLSPEDLNCKISALPAVPAEDDLLSLLNPDGPHHTIYSAELPAAPLETRLLAALIPKLHPALRDIWPPAGGQAGDAAFLVAHGEQEATLRTHWPTPGQQSGKVVMVNDAFTAMEFVVLMLEKEFRLSREQSISTMLAIHHAGSAVLAVPEGSADAVCERLNALSRAEGRPLYLRPQGHSEASQGNDGRVPGAAAETHGIQR